MVAITLNTHRLLRDEEIEKIALCIGHPMQEISTMRRAKMKPALSNH